MRKLAQCALALTALGFAARPATAQQVTDRWYWGAQAGAILFQTVDATTGGVRTSTSALDIGGHWLITKRDIGLYMAFDQVLFQDGTTSAFNNPSSATGLTQVNFTSMQRIQASLFAMPSHGTLQPYVGLGFAIHNITDAVTTVAPTNATEAGFIAERLPEASAQAFAVVSGGFQWQMGKLAWFGQYQYMPGGSGFLLRNAEHTFIGGLRYALGPAHEEVGTEK